jgi:DNA-binding NarL/FixJ family response regulator
MNAASPIRLVLVEDHAMFREGLAALLRSQPDMLVVGAYASGEEALARLTDDRPDLVLLDVRLPGLDGPSILAQMRRQRPDLRALMLTAQEGDAFVVRALKAGAAGYVLKKQASAELVTAIRRGLTGAAPMAPEVSAQLAAHVVTPELTARELEILKGVARGDGNKEIASALGLSSHTVRNHLADVMAKLGAQDRTHAVTIAVQRGLIDL